MSRHGAVPGDYAVPAATLNRIGGYLEGIRNERFNPDYRADQSNPNIQRIARIFVQNYAWEMPAAQKGPVVLWSGVALGLSWDEQLRGDISKTLETRECLAPAEAEKLAGLAEGSADIRRLHRLDQPTMAQRFSEQMHGFITASQDSPGLLLGAYAVGVGSALTMDQQNSFVDLVNRDFIRS